MMVAGGFQHLGRAVLLGGLEEKCREDGQNSLPFLSGCRHPFRGGVQSADDRRGIIILREVANQGAVFGV